MGGGGSSISVEGRLPTPAAFVEVKMELGTCWAMEPFCLQMKSLAGLLVGYKNHLATFSWWAGELERGAGAKKYRVAPLP